MKSSGTIAAIASPRGKGLRGVIRVSGPRAWDVVESTWAGASPLPDPELRGFFEGRFEDGGGQQPLFLLWMPGPRSFTREDVAEFHLPASAPLLEAALARIFSLDVRAAEAGEFTRRAFENGRIDLTRAEGILELVRARSEAERRSASALMLGGLAARLEPLRAGLEALRALTEASLDFDEADTGHVPAAQLEREARALFDALQGASQWEARRVHAADLPRVVLVGAPNAGKSSLFNALVPEATAIVSELRGTTRDVLQGAWETGAGPVQLVDTAGLDDDARGADRAAQEHGASWRAAADLELWLADPADAAKLSSELTRQAPQAPRLLVWSKSDRASFVLPELCAEALGLTAIVSVSARTAAGLEELGRAVAGVLWAQGGADAPRIESEIGVRHRAALRAAAEGLERGLAAWRAGSPLDLFAECLRTATEELDVIGGRTTPEDLLTQIFASFCIGK